MNQDYNNHSRYVKGFHFLLGLLLISGTIISLVNVVRHPANRGGFLSSLLIALLFICMLFISWFARQFPLRAQDRAIRAEESLRYFILTRKPIDSRITMAQIIALRFAPDEEFVPLVDKAAAENMSPDDIKKSIKEWRADHHRA